MYRQNCCRGVYAYEISRHASPGTYREERRSNLICGNSIVKRREQRAANRQADIVFYNVLSRPGIKILRVRCDTETATTDLIPSLVFYQHVDFSIRIQSLPRFSELRSVAPKVSSFFLSIFFLGTSRLSLNARKKKKKERKDRIPFYQEVRCHGIFKKDTLEELLNFLTYFHETHAPL